MASITLVNNKYAVAATMGAVTAGANLPLVVLG